MRVLIIIASAWFVIVGSVVATSGCGHYDAGWRAAASLRAAGELTDTALAQAANAKHQACRKKYSAHTMGYARCIQSVVAGLDQWIHYARPAIDSALIATATGLAIAEKSGKSGYKWTDSLKPGACAIVDVIRKWRHLSKALEKIAGRYLDPLNALCGGAK